MFSVVNLIPIRDSHYFQALIDINGLLNDIKQMEKLILWKPQQSF